MIPLKLIISKLNFLTGGPLEKKNNSTGIQPLITQAVKNSKKYLWSRFLNTDVRKRSLTTYRKKN